MAQKALVKVSGLSDVDRCQQIGEQVAGPLWRGNGLPTGQAQSM